MNDIRGRFRVGVIGGSRAGREALLAAERIGRLVAEREGIIVCGGLGGVMEAACRGAREAGGLAIGILPGNDPADANAFVDVPLATGLGYTRNSLVALNADVLIAVDGEYGTLSEIAFGIIYGKTVIGLGTWAVKGVVPVGTPEEAVELAFKR
ncbi:MAG: TIGR00725 family protein [Candidatus Aminicenantes bacterium]|nr:TIGR00725 family protein [Candidatus Aminicenantes bacterium]